MNEREREKRARVVAAALDVGIDATIKDDAIILTGKHWTSMFGDATTADVFITGYLAGFADALQEAADTTLAVIRSRGDRQVKPPGSEEMN